LVDWLFLGYQLSAISYQSVGPGLSSAESGTGQVPAIAKPMVLARTGRQWRLMRERPTG